jgi:PKD repeat protein
MRLTPQQNITINDADGDAMILTWYSNSSGSWVAFGSNSSVGNGTCHQANSNFSGYDTKYWWNVTVTDGLDTNTSATYHFTTRSQYVPDPPTNFSASANGQTQIDLSWTKGNKADNTSIEWNTIETWSRGDGTELYNGTGNSTSHSGLSPETTRYYQAWSWNDTGNCWSISNATCSATTESSGGAPPERPGGGDTTPPTTPTNVRCTTPEADDTPSFAWDAATDSSGISGYYVKIDNGTDIEVGDVLTWTSADNVEDGNHTFYVKAKDASSNGNIGSYGSCSFTIDTIEGADPPIAVANGPYIGLTFQIISFDGSDSHDVGGAITNYTWDFGDGTSGYGINPTHIYNLSGTYTITLTVTDTEGLTDSDTTAATIELDSDGDGWSDDMENSYGTNATDPTDQLKDTDGDGIPDDDSPDGNYTGDPDDDDDGLNDEIEEKLGSDPKNATDVKSLDMEGNYIIDIDGDGQHDKFYNATSKINTTIEVQDGGTYLIDSNGNGKWDYTYDPKSGEILPYETQEPKREFPWLLIIIGTITAIVVIIFLLFKTGFLYVEEKKPEE